jgi:hypothetical protein
LGQVITVGLVRKVGVGKNSCGLVRTVEDWSEQLGIGQNSWGLGRTVGVGQPVGVWAEQLGVGHNNWRQVRKLEAFKKSLGLVRTVGGL